MTRLILIGLIFLSGELSSPLFAESNAKHVVVLVWDGMRPDFVTEQNCPTLFRLSRQGVWFENHHPVFVSATEVNGTAIATGAYPAHDGIVNNTEYRPLLNPFKRIRTEDLETVRKGDELTHGNYLHTPTVAEILRRKGMHTAIAGAKPVALLHDRAVRPANSRDVDIFAGKSVPPNVAADIASVEGAFPDAKKPRTGRNDWTTQALIDGLWKNGVPEYSLLWLDEPDFTQHATGPGSAKSLAAIKNADDELARVIAALEAKGVRKQTDIIVVSDHGFSTILSLVDLAEDLTNAGFNAQREFNSQPNKGDIFVCGNTGAMLLYVTGHDQKDIEKLVTFLQGWAYTGVIFTRKPMDGTFTLAQAHIDSPDAPDVMVSMRWKADRSDNGTPGMLISDICSYPPGGGMHGSLSPFDVHNTCVAAGPDFRSGVVDHLPSGNVDVAPTILWILGVKQPRSMDGLVLWEALANNESKIKSYEPNHIEAMRDLGNMVWHQYLNYSEVDGVTYLEEGNGFQTTK